MTPDNAAYPQAPAGRFSSASDVGLPAVSQQEQQHRDREAFIHIASVRAARQAADMWDRLAQHPGAYHAAALRELCASRNLPPSSGCDCGYRISDFPDLPVV